MAPLGNDVSDWFLGEIGFSVAVLMRHLSALEVRDPSAYLFSNKRQSTFE
jgi:hypothetical protein